MKPKIIAFSGLQGAGKSTAAAIVGKALSEKGYEVQYEKFADPIYDIVNGMCNRLHIPFEKSKLRPVMQFIGMHFRDTYTSDFWRDQWEFEVKQALFWDKVNKEGLPNTIILTDDLRFNNEAEKIKEMGGKIINIQTSTDVRAGRMDIVGAEHASERGIPESFIDATVYNNKSLLDLELNLKYILTIFNLL